MIRIEAIAQNTTDVTQLKSDIREVTLTNAPGGGGGGSGRDLDLGEGGTSNRSPGGGGGKHAPICA